MERGVVELFIPDKEATIKKKRLGVGEFFVQVVVMNIHQHTVSAVSVEDTEFIVLSKHALHQLYHEDVELFALLMMDKSLDGSSIWTPCFWYPSMFMNLPWQWSS